MDWDRSGALLPSHRARSLCCLMGTALIAEWSEEPRAEVSESHRSETPIPVRHPRTSLTTESSQQDWLATEQVTDVSRDGGSHPCLAGYVRRSATPSYGLSAPQQTHPVVEISLIPPSGRDCGSPPQRHSSDWLTTLSHRRWDHPL
jgi:hypothetical protein